MCRKILLCGLAAMALATISASGAGPEQEKPSALLDRIGLSRGICALVGDQQAKTACQLARQSQLRCLVTLSGMAEVLEAARAADSAGLYGRQVFVEMQPWGRIGLADNTADAVVVLGDPAAAPKPEILRVLRPQGKGIVGSQLFTKPVPEGIDVWSHHYHGPDNNPQSRDRLARWPYLTQFIAEPRYGPAPQAAVAAGGRLFMAFGHVAWHQREEPWLNTLVVLNAYNGTLLWQRPLVPGIMVDRSTMIATPEVLYLADDKSCKVLEAATGRELDEIVAPVGLTGGTFWKWMALEDGILYALVGQQEPPDPDAKWRSTGHGWPWDGISKGYNAPKYPWGFARTLLAIDPKNKKVLWSHQEDPPIDSRALCMAAGRIYLGSFGNYLVCLDAPSGKELWRRTPQKDPEVFQMIGPYRPGHGYIGGWKSTVWMKCTDQALYIVGPQVEWLTALSTEDGRVLFRHPVKDLHIVIRDEGLYCIGPQHSTDQTKRLDPLTGRVLASYNIQRRACTRSTGTPDGIFFRGHEGSGRLDIATGQVQWLSPMRPSCHVGVVVAHGHLYWLPWACDCNLQMFGAICLSPAGQFPFDQKATEAERLERFAMPGAEPDLPAPADNQWPTFRANPARTAQVDVAIPARVELVWRRQLNGGGPLTAPTAAGGLVFVAGHDGVVRALDAADGQVRWTAYTGGPVLYPPTIYKRLALVGSSDGWVYALAGATGRLIWRFRAAPAERKIPVYGQLISTWPVASGVLVQDGLACFAAGMNDFDGTHVYALKADSGTIRWQNNTCGHLDALSRRGVACQGEMLFHDGKLYLAGGNTVSPAVFDFADGRCLNPPPGGMGSQAPRGRELHLAGNRVIASGQPLYSLPETPVFDKSVQWSDVVVIAKNAELTLRQQRPALGPGWVLAARDRHNGQPLWTQMLPGEPVRWGIAVSGQGRIVVSLRSGQVLCYGNSALAAR